ncbi:MAG: hypothetical protein SO253_00935 [Bacilli bacterium]|nr:hypothetical protein [Bacilli bacterium]
MKKIFKYLTIVLMFFMLTSCYTDQRKKDMDLKEIVVYDSKGSEVKGEYDNYYDRLDRVPLNSAAPVVNYYFVDVTENETYTVHFKFNSIRNYKMKSLTIKNDQNEEKSVHEDVEFEGNYLICKVTFNNVHSGFNSYSISSWIDSEEKNHHFGIKGSNTYLRGIYFNIISK